MQKTILIAGYTKSAYVEIIREYFENEEIILACAYTRPPKTETKEEYLKKFDVLFNLNNEEDVEKLKETATSVALVTCTQERDMETYIQTLTLCGKITAEQEAKYNTAINKLEFKKELSTTHPELVPNVNVVNNELMEKLDTLSYPQVIKPSGLAGSILIKIVNSPEEFKSHYESFAGEMKKIGTEFYEKNIEVITEEYISGPQYSVNIYVDSDQNITFCPISRVITPQELGIDDSYSALQYTTDEINGEKFEDLKTAVRTVIEHFGIHSTSAHFDSVLHTSGWKFFEVGLRIGGHRQGLYELSHGMNHFKNDILNRLGEEVVIPEQKNSVCIMQKAAEKSGTLNNISYTRTIKQDRPPLIKESKMAKVGSEVMPLALGGGTIARHLIWGKVHKEVIDESTNLFKSINFDIS